MWFYRKVQGKGKQRDPGKIPGSLSFCTLLANTAGATVFGTMPTIVTGSAGSAITRTLTGCMMFSEIVMITGKSGSKGGNSHQGRYGKNSFHNWVFELRG